MLIQQTHFPRVGPDWEKIAMITLGVVIVSLIVYQAFKPLKVSRESASDPNSIDKTE